MDVVGHCDEGVKFVETLDAVVLEGFEEELCVGFGLEETASIGGDGRYEKGADFLRGERHSWSLEYVRPRAKAQLWGGSYSWG